MRKIKCSCYGACGELFQGIVEGEERLISYHIDQKNTVEWHRSNRQDEALEKMQLAKQFIQNELVGNEKNDNERVIDRTSMFNRFRREEPSIPLKHTAQLPIGKGCASSTADILITLQTIGYLKGVTFSPEQLTQYCAKVEPTDSIAFAKWTAIHPLTGQYYEQFDWQPELFVYKLEPATMVDTQRLPRMSRQKGFDVVASEQLYRELTYAITQQNLFALGEITTTAATLNQRRLFKPYLTDIRQFVKTENLLGMNIAHSGTVIGILLTANDKERIVEIEENIKRQAWANYYQKRTLHQVMYQGVEIDIWH